MKSFVSTVFLCAVMVAPAFGTIIVSGSAPTGGAAVIAQPHGGGDIRDPFYTSASNRRAIGSTFDLNSESPFVLNAITMKLRVGTEVEAPIVGSAWVASVFTLSADNDGTPDAYLNSAGDKRTAVGTMPALTFSADNYVTFVLPFDVNINAGQQYGFMVDFASANANNVINGSGNGWVGSSKKHRRGFVRPVERRRRRHRVLVGSCDPGARAVVIRVGRPGADRFGRLRA
jgi:hypothetical protein